jgi:hypothetical protein
MDMAQDQVQGVDLRIVASVNDPRNVTATLGNKYLSLV